MNGNEVPQAAKQIRAILPQAYAHPDVKLILSSRDRVLSKWGPKFRPREALDSLTIEEFREFLKFRENRHWTLDRLASGGFASGSTRVLGEAIARLCDESVPLPRRYDEAVNSAPGMGKAVATAVLHVAHPQRYGIWNRTSETALLRLGIWPLLPVGTTAGTTYAAVNEVLLDLSKSTGLHLWDLDAIFWFLVSQAPSSTAYLLVWNPDHYPWPEYSEDARKVANQVIVESRRGVLSSSVRKGDRIFLMMVGGRRGMVGSGCASCDPYEDRHRFDPSKSHLWVVVRWEALLDPEYYDPLSLEELRNKVSSKQEWTPRQAGIAIRREVVPMLEEAWQRHLEAVHYPTRDAVAPMTQASSTMEDLFIDCTEFDTICRNLLLRKNVILQGPPGVGKTFVAKKVAREVTGSDDPSLIQWVQFHQSYSYEDFVEGYRPAAGGGFELRQGLFLKFCERAAADPDNKYVLIVDEINRGNLSRIFGEVLSLIEEDKRGKLEAVLAYSERPFTVPDNVYLLGLMNTADRSLAVVDYALRRRFAFHHMEPQFDSPRFEELLSRMGVSGSMIGAIRHRMTELNRKIRDDHRDLGQGFEIGHSYFCPRAPVENERQWYEDIIRYHIEPLLREYWFDDKKEADAACQALLG